MLQKSALLKESFICISKFLRFLSKKATVELVREQEILKQQ